MEVIPPSKDLRLSESLIKTTNDNPTIAKKLKELEGSERETQRSKEKVEKLQKEQEILIKKYPLSKNDRGKLDKIEKETKVELKKIAEIKDSQDNLVKDLNKIYNDSLAKEKRVDIDPSWYPLPGDSETVVAIKKDIEIMNKIITTENDPEYKGIRDELAKKLELELKKEN